MGPLFPHRTGIPMLLTGKSPILKARGLFAIGVVSLVIGVWGLTRNVDFLAHVVRAPAEVVAVETEGPDQPFRKYTPHVVFALPDGTTINTPAGETYRPTQAGEQVSVGYDPRDPTDVRLMDLRDMCIIPIYPFVFGLITLGLAYQRWRAEQAVKAADA